MSVDTIVIVVLSVALLLALLALYAIATGFQGTSGERPDGTHRAPGASIRLRSGDAQPAGDSSASRQGHPWDVTLSSDDINDPAFGDRDTYTITAPNGHTITAQRLPDRPSPLRVVANHMRAMREEQLDELVDERLRRLAWRAARGLR